MSADAKNSTVTAADQQLINKFARLHQNFTQIKADMRALANELSNINEAADELLLLDDEDAASIPYKIGQVFVHFNQEEMTEKLEEAKIESEGKLKTQTDEANELEQELNSLKSTLYAKFGDRINLETDKDD